MWTMSLSIQMSARAKREARAYISGSSAEENDPIHVMGAAMSGSGALDSEGHFNGLARNLQWSAMAQVVTYGKLNRQVS